MSARRPWRPRSAPRGARPARRSRPVRRRGTRLEPLERLGVEHSGRPRRTLSRPATSISPTSCSLRDVKAGAEATVVGRVHEVRVKKPRPDSPSPRSRSSTAPASCSACGSTSRRSQQRFAVGERVAFAGKVETRLRAQADQDAVRREAGCRARRQRGGPRAARPPGDRGAFDRTGSGGSSPRRSTTTRDVPDHLPADAARRARPGPARSGAARRPLPAHAGRCERRRIVGSPTTSCCCSSCTWRCAATA